MRHLHSTALSLLLCPLAFAGGVQGTDGAGETVVIEASHLNQIGVSDSANQGVVTAQQLENRPLLRTGELLEAVPGVIVTQHSGDGKANQYFLRGFNLDHGTDFRTTVLGMPVNMPTHAHGQGYTDVNFVIPELVKSVQYKKGTYYAEEGDFSAAGAAAIDYQRRLDTGIATIETGSHGYRRALLADSAEWQGGDVLFAIERAGQNGPWDLPEDYGRWNGYLSYSRNAGDDQLRLAAMAYDSSWNATDQVPLRALLDGRIGRYGNVDPTDGGATARYSLSADWRRHTQDGSWKANAYWIASRLDLYSDFTYALEDPVHGDQFHQSERRHVAGFNAERLWQHRLLDRESETSAGMQLRADRVSPLGLYATAARQYMSTTREDTVHEDAAALYLSNSTRWSPQLRTVTGLRADRYSFDVASNRPENSGHVDASIVSPKFSAIVTASSSLEFYLNWGRGFHSNDARGVTISVDPKTGTSTDTDGNAVTRATPLARATGKEIGLRTASLVPGLQTSLSLWQLDLDSELVFLGDAGTTEASRPSRRQGAEIANYYQPRPGWIIDADLAWSHARFTDNDPAGSSIPGAIERTLSVGITAEQGKWSGGLRLRYFGSRPLIEDDSVRAPSSTLVNAKLGYAFTPKVKLAATVLNVFDRRASDIDYYYASRLPGEAAAVNDIHTHPAEPRSIRLALTIGF
jgi:hypothetical protein